MRIARPTALWKDILLSKKSTPMIDVTAPLNDPARHHTTHPVTSLTDSLFAAGSGMPGGRPLRRIMSQRDDAPRSVRRHPLAPQGPQATPL